MLLKVLSANAATSTSAEKISGQTNKQTDIQTNKQTNKLEGYSRHSRQPSLNKVLSGLVIAKRKSHFPLSKTK